MTNKYFLIFAAMLLAAGGGAAQSSDNDAAPRRPGFPVPEKQDGDWISYRDVYRVMIRFEKYGKPKQLIQNNFQIIPKEKGATLDDLHLTLQGKTIRLNLPVDAAGRVMIPLLKAAYDENAELSFNRRIGMFAFQSRVSIAPRADGVYEAGDLQLACQQVLNYLRYSGEISSVEKKCTGVRFSYAKNANDVAVKFRTGERLSSLPVRESGAFPEDATTTFKAVTYRFSDWPEHGQVVTQSAPIAIAALFD